VGTVSAQFGISKLNYLVLARPQFFAEEPAVFSIDWQKGAIPIEKEICTLATDAAGKILDIIPIRDSKR
jgi:hypothetical protein